MKRLSIVLALLVLALSSSHSNGHSHEHEHNHKHKKCKTEWFRAVPCYPQILDFSLGGLFLSHKIDPKCCKTIIELADQCNHRHLHDPLFAAAHKNCVDQKSHPSPPSPLPPPPSPHKKNRFCRLKIVPFMLEIVFFSHNRISKPSEACCAAVLGAQKDCRSSQKWDDAFLKCADYCRKNHP